MGYEDLANVNRVIEFIHEYKNCGLKETGLVNDDSILDVLFGLENIRKEIVGKI